MRTTINVDAALLREAKKLAAESGRTLTVVIEDALRAVISRRRERSGPRPALLTTVGGKGLQPGVDLDDSASLLDLMERARDSR